MTALGMHRPNPFKDGLVIPYALAKPARVRIEIYNVRGQMVKELTNALEGTGYAHALWDGTDSNGRRVSAGVYYIRFTAGNVQHTKKAILIR